TIKETGAKARVDVIVTVVPPPSAEKITLDQPTLQPGGIPIATSTPVTFMARAIGTKVDLQLLELQECEPKAKFCGAGPDDTSWTRVDDLLDDGKDPDSFAGDGVYSRRLNVTGTKEGEKLYRVRASQGNEVVVSSARFLKVTRFPVGPGVGPKLPPPEIIKDPSNGARFAAERVLVSFLPRTSPDLVEKIISEVTKEILGTPGRVVGYLPEIGTLIVQLFIIGPKATPRQRADAVTNTVKALKLDDAVRYAEPDFALELGGLITPDRGDTDQWGVKRIRADEAWVVTRAKGFKVAVVDTGVDTGSHSSDLSAVTGDTTDDSTNPDGHGTGVAGVLAAVHGNGIGISGIAHGISIKSERVGSVIESPNHFGANGIIRAANDATVKIINFPWFTAWDNVTLKCALEYAVAGTGVNVLNCSDTTTTFVEPQGPLTGRGTLVVAAAGNDGMDISTCSDFSCLRYPCVWDDPNNSQPDDPGLVLCVGNTTVSDPTKPLESADQVFEGNQTTWGKSCGSVLPSNYGQTVVDIWAPGTCILTTKKNGGLGWATGTSFATAYVSGAAAVVWTKMEMERELQAIVDNVTAYDVRQALLQSADPFNTIMANGTVVSGDRLDLLEALFTDTKFTDKDDRCAIVDNLTPSLSTLHGKSLTYCEGSEADGQWGPQLGSLINHLRIRDDLVTDVALKFNYGLITCDYSLSPLGSFKVNTDQATIGLFLDSYPPGYTGLVGNFVIT
ncbi:MAG: S8 family serine peptidase, partial [Deltaproteobacteria bacterium]|nr:S8 family serine peptidase [Deltaproteobacteria bacterium]